MLTLVSCPCDAYACACLPSRLAFCAALVPSPAVGWFAPWAHGAGTAGVGAGGSAAAGSSTDVLTLASLMASTGVIAWANEAVGYVTLTGSVAQVCCSARHDSYAAVVGRA